MTWQEVLTQIIIPLIAGFAGGSFSNVIIKKIKTIKINKMSNNKSIFSNSGVVVNGDKR